MSKLHWLPVQSRMSFGIACLAYEILSYTSQPVCMQALFYHYAPHPIYAELTNTCLSHLMFPLCLANNPLITSALKTWNSLPLRIRLSPTLETFKRCLKTECFVKQWYLLPCSLITGASVSAFNVDIVHLMIVCIIIVMMMQKISEINTDVSSLALPLLSTWNMTMNDALSPSHMQ